MSCAACGGNGTTVIPCGECIEGKAKCGNSKCREGQVRCEDCGGTGSRFKGYQIGRIPRGGGGVMEACRTTVNCPKCKGNAVVDCKACRKRGTVVVQCFSCEGAKMERCLSCYGTGKVGDPDPDPTAGKVEEKRPESGRPRVEEADLRDAMGFLEDAARSASKLDQERRAVLEGMERLGTRIDALARRASEEPALRQAAQHLLRRWKASHNLALESAQKIEKALSEALSGEWIQELERLASDLESGRAVARLEDRIASARKRRREVVAIGGRVSGLVEDLRLWEKETGAFEARLKAYLASKELGRKKAEEVRSAYLRVEEKIASLAKKGEMPVVECELLEPSSPDALFVKITYFDESATVSETPEDSVPCDAGLAKVPAFISAVLRECPKVERIRLVVDATCLTETGLEERRSIQRFTMDRRRWKELVAGRHKGEWWTLLSKSQPAPEYPRPARIPEGTWPIVALLGICFLGTAIVLAVRTRMLA